MESKTKRIFKIGTALLLCASQSFAADIQSKRVLVALENGGAVEVDARTGEIKSQISTGPNAFGAIYSRSGRAFITDKNEGTLIEICTKTGRVLNKITLGTQPQQPALTSRGLMFVPMSGEASIAVVQTEPELELIRKISTGSGTKPHIVSLSPNQETLYATVQGTDPKIMAFTLSENEITVKGEFRDNIVPRVVAATNLGAFYTGHHSTGLHAITLSDGMVKTIFMDSFGSASIAAKQIEGVASNEDATRAFYTHEGRKAVVAIEQNAEKKFVQLCDISPLADKPYWVSLDSGGTVAFVSIPDKALVEAYDIELCNKIPIWSTSVGGKAKRLALFAE